MTPKQFYNYAAKELKEYKVTYLTVSVEYVHFRKLQPKTAPQVRFNISVQCTFDHVYVNVGPEVTKTPQLAVAAAKHFLDERAKNDPDNILIK